MFTDFKWKFQKQNCWHSTTRMWKIKKKIWTQIRYTNRRLGTVHGPCIISILINLDNHVWLKCEKFRRRGGDDDDVVRSVSPTPRPHYTVWGDLTPTPGQNTEKTIYKSFESDSINQTKINTDWSIKFYCRGQIEPSILWCNANSNSTLWCVCLKVIKKKFENAKAQMS
jgi:hypothetical protein